MGEKVYSPIIEEGMADYVLSFEEVEAVRWAKLLKKDGILLVNSQKIKSLPVLLGNAEYPENIKDSLEASASGKAKVVEFAGMDFPKELWIEAINEAFASKAKLIPMNVEAFNKGRDFVS